MKIAFTGLDLTEGKMKYQDPILDALVKQVQPKKITPYYFELTKNDYESAEATVILKERILDLLVLDIERIENRLSKATDGAEIETLKKCLAGLEQETPVCDVELTGNERQIVNALVLQSFKPTLVLEAGVSDVNDLFRKIHDKAGMMFFYTTGKQEVRAWPVRKGSNAVDCAGKIHSDLARGFIKAEIVDVKVLLTTRSFQDARAKGLTKLVDRDYVLEPETALEIHFNV